MSGSARRIRLSAGVALSALILVVGSNSFANAQSATDAQIKALQAQVDVLVRTVKELKEAQTHTAADAKAAKKQASEAEASSALAKATAADASARSTKAPVKAAGWGGLDSNGHYFLERKPGKDLTFYTPGGEITAYGNLDVSFDATTKNAGSLNLNGSSPPVGNFGWMPAISTNLSYLGVRGFQRIPDQSFNFVYQAEVGFDISATPGLKQSNSNLSDTVNGSL